MPPSVRKDAPPETEGRPAAPSTDGSSTINVTEHQMGIEDVMARYGSRVNLENPNKSLGLTEAAAQTLLAHDGPNAISPPRKKPVWVLFASQFLGLFNVLLIVSGALSMILFAIDTASVINLYLGIILLFVVIANASIDFYQQYRTAAILESFLSLVPPACTVIREERLHSIAAAGIVVGDLLFLKAGDKIPADCRLFHVTDMKVDNSSITGESDALERSVGSGSQPDNPLEATNLAFSGTTVVNGEGYGIAIRTGDRSVLGQIAKLTIGERTPPSQLTVEINLYVRMLAAIAIVTAIIFFVVCLVMGYGIGMTFSFAIGVFVAFVPQGLPLTVSTLLTIAAKRMARRNVLVKNLHAVETLGSITLLASDKTGTLTQNKMTVVGLWLNDAFYATTPEMMQDIALTPDTPNLPAVVQACALCTRSKFVEAEKDLPLPERTIHGDATEIGLLRFAGKYIDAPAEQTNYRKVFEIPFSSATKWHLTVHRMDAALPMADAGANVDAGAGAGADVGTGLGSNDSRDGSSSLFSVIIKGAPERVAAKCKYIQVGGQVLPWTEETTDKFNEAYEHFAINGRRLIAFGRHFLPAGQFGEDFVFCRDPCNIPLDEFVFIGLVAIMDPPKRGVKKAVAALRTAGIQLVMVTGDHPLTAEAIARQIGLISGETIVQASLRLQKPLQLVTEDEYDAVVVHGDKIEGLSDGDWDRILAKEEIVFARTSPQQKLEIVTRFQNKGHIVGVSGDGVNDSPALKKADLGISMNKTASDVSKEAAAMILLDDHFPSIVNGIAEGRLIFANLKKSIRYTITHTMPEVVAFLVFVVLAIPLPLNSLLILLIDLGSELGPALSFAFEPPENDLMLVPPRKVLCSPIAPAPTGDDAAGEALAPEASTVIKDIESNVGDTGLNAGNAGLNAGDTDPAIPPPSSPSRPSLRLSWLRWGWQKTLAYFARSDTGDVLVDSDMILWAFLQGGIIETMGCFGAYLITLAVRSVPFNMLVGSAGTYWKEGAPPLLLVDGTIATADMQVAISGSSQSAYYAAIVICQIFVLWVTKHRFDYPYGWDMLRNKYTYAGVAAALAVAAVVIYVPGLNSVVLGGGPVPVLALLSPLGAGILLIAYEFGRILLRRKGYFGGIPKANANLLALVRTTSSVK